MSGWTVVFLLSCCVTMWSGAQDTEGETAGGAGSPAPVGDTAAPQTLLVAEPAADQGQVKSAELRDPFRPVSYKAAGKPKDPADKLPVVPTNSVVDRPSQAVDWEYAEKQLKVTGFSPDGKGGFIAVVNGQVVAAGDTLPIPVQGNQYIWMIRSITKERGLSLDRLNVRPVTGGK